MVALPLSSEARLLRRMRALGVLACVITGGIVVLVVLGWKFTPDWPASFLPGRQMTRPITALALALGILSVALSLRASGRSPELAARGTGLALALVGLLTFGERLLELPGGLSEFAFRVIGVSRGAGVVPWMAPNACLSFFLLGLALFLLPSPEERARRNPAPWLALAALLPASIALLGYVYGVEPLFLVGKHTAMALPTALGLACLAFAALAIRPDQGPQAILVSPRLGGFVLRRLLPAAILAPPVLGWLRLQGEFSGLYDIRMGTALFAFANVLFFTALIVAVVNKMVRLEGQLEHEREVNRAVLESAPVALVLLDENQRVTRANRGAFELLGCSPGELRPDALRVLSAAPSEGQARESPPDPALARALREGRVLREHEAIFTHPDGRTVALLCSTTPVHTESGTRGALLLAIDITARKQAEAAMQLAMRRFETLANLIPQFVWSTRPDGHPDFFNERWHEFTGMPRGHGPGVDWRDYVHPDDLAPAEARWRHCLATGEPYEVQCRFRRASDGAHRWFIGRAVPVREPGGGIVRWFGTCTDIEDQRREGEKLEALVAERTARLQESVAELEHFSYTLTHDMRAPLRAMRGFALVLLEEQAPRLDEEGRGFLRRIMTAATRMDQLILDALDYAKIARSDFTLAPIEPGPLLHELIDSYPEFQPPRADVSIIGPLPPVLGNEAGLTQCFSNLLGNAVKFVAPGVMPTVRVLAESAGGRVRLVFEDNGVGVPPAQRERIFGMFQRLDLRHEGTGVGLALVRKVVGRMRGRVEVESGRDGRGSRFYVELAAG